MDEIIELENFVSDEGMSTVHLMSNFELTAEALRKYYAPVDAKAEIKKEAGVYHLRATWPLRGPLEFRCEGWPVAKIYVVWHLSGCESVRDAIHEAAKMYREIFGESPREARIRELRAAPSALRVSPPNDEKQERHLEGEREDLMLFDAEWMVRECVAVGHHPILRNIAEEKTRR